MLNCFLGSYEVKLVGNYLGFERFLCLRNRESIGLLYIS